jgi:hypothetical protein
MSIQEFELLHPTGVVVSRRLIERELLASLPAIIATRRDMHAGVVRYSLPKFVDGDSDVLISIALSFKSEFVLSMEISDANPEFGTGWSSWPEEKEQARAASIAKWFPGRGYSPGRYLWGKVWVTYDPRNGCGFGGVRYA